MKCEICGAGIESNLMCWTCQKKATDREKNKDYFEIDFYKDDQVQVSFKSNNMESLQNIFIYYKEFIDPDQMCGPVPGHE